MKKIILLAFIAVFCNQTNVFSQTKKLTPEDAAYLNRELYPKQMNQLQWLGDADRYAYVEDGKLMVQDAEKKTNSILLTLEQLNKIFEKQGFESVKNFPRFRWIDDQSAWFISKGSVFVINLKTKTIAKKATLPEGAENIEVALPSFKVSYTIENNLFIATEKEQIQLTDNAKNIVAGQPVHRNEFGIAQSSFWSNDNKKLAYYLMDETMVTDYPLVDIDTRIATVRNTKYPMSGMTSHQVKLMIYNVETKQTIAVQTGEPADQYLTAITWNPDNKNIFIGLLNRGQDHLKFNMYNVENGTFVKTLFEETSDKYVEPLHSATFLPNKADQFVWQSRRDGFNHLYLYKTDGTLIKQLTQGNWEITDFVGFDKKGTSIFYTSTAVSPLERHFYKQNLDAKKGTQLTTETGTHRVQPSKSGKYFLDTYSSGLVPNKVLVLSEKGKTLHLLFEAENPLTEYNLGETILVTLKSDEGHDLYARMIKPADFDPVKKYPVVVYVYGGPHSQMISNSWLYGANFYLNYLAQEGYIVFTLDNRGTSNRGTEFEQAIFRQCGQVEMQDQMTGIAYLKTLPYVDSERIGVDGWSYGGFMSISLKLNHPETFKVATAGGPVIDWKYYEIMYGERYMDSPDENPEGYELTSLLNKADKLEGKLLVIHCTTDPVVVWQNSLTFIEACIKAGKLVDYFVYPGHDHNVYGKDRAHLIRKITNYFNENL